MTQYMKWKSDPHSIEISAADDGQGVVYCRTQTTHDNMIITGSIPFTVKDLKELRKWCSIQITKMQKKKPAAK